MNSERYLSHGTEAISLLVGSRQLITLKPIIVYVFQKGIQKGKSEPYLLKGIRKRQLQVFRHIIIRNDGLEKKIPIGNIEGRRERGH